MHSLPAFRTRSALYLIESQILKGLNLNNFYCEYKIRLDATVFYFSLFFILRKVLIMFLINPGDFIQRIFMRTSPFLFNGFYTEHIPIISRPLR